VFEDKKPPPPDVYFPEKGKGQICFFSTANPRESIMAISKTVISKTTQNWK